MTVPTTPRPGSASERLRRTLSGFLALIMRAAGKLPPPAPEPLPPVTSAAFEREGHRLSDTFADLHDLRSAVEPEPDGPADECLDDDFPPVLVASGVRPALRLPPDPVPPQLSSETIADFALSTEPPVELPAEKEPEPVQVPVPAPVAAVPLPAFVAPEPVDAGPSAVRSWQEVSWLEGFGAEPDETASEPGPAPRLPALGDMQSPRHLPPTREIPRLRLQPPSDDLTRTAVVVRDDGPAVALDDESRLDFGRAQVETRRVPAAREEKPAPARGPSTLADVFGSFNWE